MYKNNDSPKHDITPDSFDKFLEIKYNINNEWSTLKYQYRTVNRYEVDGNVPASKIYELHEIGIDAKAKFTGKARKQANMGICELDNTTLFANSQVNQSTDPYFKNFSGDRSKLVLLKEDRLFSNAYKSVGNRANTYVDSESKFFEYAADICSDGKPHTLKILSEKCMCPSCKQVMMQFSKQFPDVDIQVVSGRTDREVTKHGEFWNKRVKYRKKKETDAS